MFSNASDGSDTGLAATFEFSAAFSLYPVSRFNFWEVRHDSLSSRLHLCLSAWFRCLDGELGFLFMFYHEVSFCYNSTSQYLKGKSVIPIK
jgi:hypothetical protein